MKPRQLIHGLLLLSGILVAASAQSAQTAKPRTPSQVLLGSIASVERELTGVATEMPEDKYQFAPTAGAFRGVRNFAEQVKHAAAVHHLVAATILGEPVTSDMADERGPDSVKTKADVLKYLSDSFAQLKKAASTIDEKNAFAAMKIDAGSVSDTRMGLMLVALTHASNHYGQIVEYLRMNGHVPPG
ncbi:MAG TPA: DinB family protein [Vicinamibacterales bacterium]|jgi:uncharacterized damage-inducible protein DinB